MSEKTEVTQLIEAINHNTQWIGRTTRELRDKVEMQANETSKLTTSLNHSAVDAVKALDRNVATLSADIVNLTHSIRNGSENGAVLSRRMYWLTIILALAAVVQAMAAYFQIVI